MNTTTYQLTCRQGTTFRKRFRFRIDGVPLNIEGYKAVFQVRPKATSSTLYIDATTESGKTITTATGSGHTHTVTVSFASYAALASGVTVTSGATA